MHLYLLDQALISFYFVSVLFYIFGHSLFGWDHVTQGLVQLGFTLMDAFGPKSFGMCHGLFLFQTLGGFSN